VKTKNANAKAAFVPVADNLYKRGDIFYCRLYVNGGTKWVSLRTKVKGVAKVEKAKQMQQHYAVRKAKAAAREGSATVGDLATLYLQSVDIDTELKPASKEYRHKTVKYLLRSWPELSDRQPNRVTETECKEWAARYVTDFSETLYNNTVDSLRHILDLAIERGLLNRNPAAEVSRVTVPPRKLELPSSEKFRAIIVEIRKSNQPTNQGSADLVEFMAYSGCRISEAIGVGWPDVDDQRGRIWIGPSKHDEKGRSIPILEPMRDLLSRIKATPRFFKSKTREQGGYVLSVIQCRRILTAACAKVKTTRITHHDLRHLFATRCIESGVDIPTVSRWLGHRDGGALAMKVYGHLRDEHSQAMAAKVTF
jgi:integrase